MPTPNQFLKAAKLFDDEQRFLGYVLYHCNVYGYLLAFAQAELYGNQPQKNPVFVSPCNAYRHYVKTTERAQRLPIYQPIKTEVRPTQKQILQTMLEDLLESSPVARIAISTPVPVDQEVQIEPNSA